jgi:hypothetical protein
VLAIAANETRRGFFDAAHVFQALLQLAGFDVEGELARGDVDGDAIAVDDRGDRATFVRLGGDMADTGTGGGAAEATVGDEAVFFRPMISSIMVMPSISGMPGPPFGPS